MKRHTLSISEFKAKCLRLLDEVDARGDVLVITKRGRAIAEVKPHKNKKADLRDTWKGIASATGDIVYFDSSDDWESAR